MLVHRRVSPSINFAGTHLYTWVERGTVRVKCLVQEHNAMTPARAQTRVARPGDERNKRTDAKKTNVKLVFINNKTPNAGKIRRKLAVSKTKQILFKMTQVLSIAFLAL